MHLSYSRLFRYNVNHDDLVQTKENHSPIRIRFVLTGQQPQQQPGKVLTGDLDSSLAQLANNLTINKTATAQK